MPFSSPLNKGVREEMDNRPNHVGVWHMTSMTRKHWTQIYRNYHAAMKYTGPQNTENPICVYVCPENTKGT